MRKTKSVPVLSGDDLLVLRFALFQFWAMHVVSRLFDGRIGYVCEWCSHGLRKRGKRYIGHTDNCMVPQVERVLKSVEQMIAHNEELVTTLEEDAHV